MKNLPIHLAAVILITLLIAGCANKTNIAKVYNSSEAEQVIRAGQVSDRYTYYLYGPEGRPDAVLALNKEYQLQSEFWHKTDPGEFTPERWQKLFNNFFKRSGVEFRGKEIVSPQSERIGLVYSRYYWITAWFEDANSKMVIIPPPELSQEQPNYHRFSQNDDS